MPKTFLPPEWGRNNGFPEASDNDTEIEVEAEKFDPNVIDTEDGGALVVIGDEEDEDGGSPEFMANLAEKLSDEERKDIAGDLLDMIERDRRSRKRRDEQYEEGLRRTGLGDDAPGGAQFDGASKVVHPVMAEACVDFAARIMKEMFPPNGPVKEKIVGKPTKEKIERANRKRDHMNWQLTEQILEYRREMEQAMTQVPLGGSQYLKWWWDEGKRRPCVEFVPIDNIYLPFSCTGLDTASRITHAMDLDAHEFDNRVESGFYMDLESLPALGLPEKSASETANDKIEGREVDNYNEDGTRRIYEVQIYYKVGKDENKLPYIITVDESSSDVLSIYRNWLEDDETEQRLDWLVELPFIPWRGAYGIGLPHLIGGLTAALTGSLRALLDSAHIANFPGALKLKGARISGGNNSIDPTQVLEVDCPPGTTDIRQVMMPLNLASPSPILFQLMGWLTDQAKGVVSTAEEKLADATNNGPVGTTQALIEQGSVVFSSIHARMHEAQKRALLILHRLNATYLTEEIKFGDDEVFITPKDYDGPMDVIPVSDPAIFSETQRFAQVQAIAMRSGSVPGIYDARKVEERILATMRIPNWEELLVQLPEAKAMNAVNENVAMIFGKPVAVFPTQDHEAHLQTHMQFMASPAFGSSILNAATFIPQCLEHIKQHVAFWYVNAVYKIVSSAAGVNAEELFSEDPDEAAALDQILAMASADAVEIGGIRAEEVAPVVMQAIKVLQSMQSQPPMDPNMISAQAQVEEVKRRAADDQMKNAAKQAEMQQRAMAAQQAHMLEIAKIEQQVEAEKAKAEVEDERQQIESLKKLIELQQQLTAAHQQYAMDLKKAELASETQLAINRDDNETALLIAAAHPRMVNGNSVTNP